MPSRRSPRPMMTTAFRAIPVLVVFAAIGRATTIFADEMAASPPAAVAPDCARGGHRLQRDPAVACGKHVYLVAWSDGTRQVDRPTADIYVARVEAGSGRVLDPSGIRVCSSPDLQECPAVSFDGDNFLVVWQDLRNGKEYHIFAARVGEDGKVLDPDGFTVAAGPSNQARPAVAFAAGNYVVTWMDGRQYPLYGLYGARVTPEGKVLDTEGRALDVEDPQKIAKDRPGGESWLGDHRYWWKNLASRFQPAMASNGRQCIVTYLSDVHSNDTTGRAMLLDPADLSILARPERLNGSPKDRVACCATADGWAVVFDQWNEGWSPSAALAGCRLDASLKPLNSSKPATQRSGTEPRRFPLIDLQKKLAGGGDTYQQGKGHFSFWQSAVAFDGTNVVAAIDYGWRTKGKYGELNSAVVAARLAAVDFGHNSPAILAKGDTAANTWVRHPNMAAGPLGELMLVYEEDGGIDHLTVKMRLLHGTTGEPTAMPAAQLVNPDCDP